MKHAARILTAFVLASLLFIYGCDKNPASPEEQELSNTEKMVVIAAEFAEPTGGVTSDFNTAYKVATGDIGALYKSASFDTTFSLGWINYSLQLNFFTKNGVPQQRYIPTVTDSIVFAGAASGHTASTKPTQEITLDRSSDFQLGDITSNIVNINGSADNHSDCKVTYSSNVYQFQPRSSYTFKDLKINLTSGNYIPTSGEIIARIKGHISKSGTGQDLDTDYDFEVTLKFIGNDEVKVTLPNGVAFILNLKTGKFSLA